MFIEVEDVNVNVDCICYYNLNDNGIVEVRTSDGSTLILDHTGLSEFRELITGAYVAKYRLTSGV